MGHELQEVARVFGACAAFALLAGGCSNLVSTQGRGLRLDHQGHPEDDAEDAKQEQQERQRQQDEQRVRATDYERQKAATEQEKKRGAGCEEEERRITAAEAAEAEQKRASDLEAELAQCPDSGIPAGTYDADGASLEVTDKGCAAYKGFRIWTGIVTKTYENQNGTYDVPYKRTFSCTVSGTASAWPPQARHHKSEGDCRHSGKIGNLPISEGNAWRVTKGATPTVTMTDDEGSKVTLRRVSTTVALDQFGLPSLWDYQRLNAGSDLDVAFAGQGAPGGWGGSALAPPPDPCRDLAEARARWESKHPAVNSK